MHRIQYLIVPTLILMLVVSIILSACDQTHIAVYEQAKYDVENLTFVKHHSGECFAVIKSTTDRGWQVTSVSWVPAHMCGGEK